MSISKENAKSIEESINLEFIDENGENFWKSKAENPSEIYGLGIINYASLWAKLMQQKINEGYSVKEIAQTTSNEADIEGITDAMYVNAVSILVKSWKYGKELLEWRKEQLKSWGCSS